MLYPISYSVPDEIIVPYVPFKILHTAKHDYQFTNSTEYLKNYRNSIFATTRLKCGWDCFRHYEILSQGTIPFFTKEEGEHTSLENCPKKTLFNFPKSQVLDLMKKYGIQTYDEIMKNSSSILYHDLDTLLQYTKQNLTTQKSAEYVLSKTSTPTTKKVLYLGNFSSQTADYMCDLLGQGLVKYTDGTVDMLPEKEFLYDSYPIEQTSKLYGKGFNYTRHLPASLKKYPDVETIWDKIKRREYDQIIIYYHCRSGNYTIPFLTNEYPIFKYYSANEVSFVCGADCDPYWSPELNWYIKMNHVCPLSELSKKGHTVFIREFGDEIS